MPKPKPLVALVSSVPDQLQELLAVVAPRYSVVVIPPGELFSLTSLPLLVILHFQAHTPQQWLLVEHLRRVFPESKVFGVGQPTQAEDVVNAYRQGILAYFMVPVGYQQLLDQLDRQAQPTWRRWWSRLTAFWQKPVPEAPLQLAAPTVLPLKPGEKVDFQLRFLGRFGMTLATGEALPMNSNRTTLLLACLLYHRHQGIDRDRLIDYFWPEVPPDCARNSLNVAMSQVRQLLKDFTHQADFIHFRDGKYLVNPVISFSSDTDIFQQLVKRGKNDQQLGNSREASIWFQQALDHYRGDFLADLPHLEWTSTIRDTWWETRLFVLEQLTSLFLEQEQFKEALKTGHQVLELDNCLERTHRQLMYAYYRSSERARALRQYAECQQILQKEFDTSPSLETTELYEIIVRQERKKVSFPLI
jgi:DNA-binding SARP family transcriptional activator